MLYKKWSQILSNELTIGRREVIRAMSVAGGVAAFGTGSATVAAASESSGAKSLAIEGLVPAGVVQGSGSARQLVPEVLGASLRTGSQAVAPGVTLEFACDPVGYDLGTGHAILADGVSGALVNLPLSIESDHVRVVIAQELLPERSYQLSVGPVVGNHPLLSRREGHSSTPVRVKAVASDGTVLARSTLLQGAKVEPSQEWMAALGLGVSTTESDETVLWLTVSSLGDGPLPPGTEVVLLGTSDIALELIDGSLRGRDDVAPRMSDSGRRAPVRVVKPGTDARPAWNLKLVEAIPGGSSLVVPLLVRQVEPRSAGEEVTVVADLRPRSKRDAWSRSGADQTEPVILPTWSGD